MRKKGSDAKNQAAVEKYRKRLDALTADTSNDERLALAQDLVAAGAATYFAALKTGSNPHSLRSRLTSGYVPELDEKGIVAAEERIVRQALTGVEKVSTRLLEMMDREQLKPPDLIRLLSVFRDTVAKKLEWGVVQPPEPPSETEREPTALEKLVERLETGQTVSIAKQEDKTITPDWWKTLPDQSEMKREGEEE